MVESNKNASPEIAKAPVVIVTPVIEDIKVPSPGVVETPKPADHVEKKAATTDEGTDRTMGQDMKKSIPSESPPAMTEIPPMAAPPA